LSKHLDLVVHADLVRIAAPFFNPIRPCLRLSTNNVTFWAVQGVSGCRMGLCQLSGPPKKAGQKGFGGWVTRCLYLFVIAHTIYNNAKNNLDDDNNTRLKKYFCCNSEQCPSRLCCRFCPSCKSKTETQIKILIIALSFTLLH
jgi:hypothetical protein